jgi:hypothetical protein
LKFFSFALDDILRPVTVSEFFTEYFGIAPLHIPGPTEKFAHLAAAALKEGCPQLTAFTQNLERALEAPVHSQAHQNWSGISLHRSDQDQIVLQISGQDLWAIHGGGAQPGDDAQHVRLEGGGVLYVPRGWWCAATPQHPDGLSLALSIRNPTGADLLVWLIERIKDHEIFQADVPRFASPAVRAEYLATLRKAVARGFRLPSLLERYAHHLNVKAPAGATLGLPWSETLPENCLAAIAAPRYPKIQRVDPETISIRVSGKDYSFPLDAAQLLQYLLDKAPLPLADFYRDFAAEFDREELTEFLSVLSNNGIITFFEPESND